MKGHKLVAVIALLSLGCFLASAGLFVFAAQSGRELDPAASFTTEQLVDGGRQEKSLLWYTASPQHKEVIKAFMARYPFVRVESIYGGGPTIAQRFYADKQRGVEFADVFTSGLNELYPEMREKGYFAPLTGLPHWNAHPEWARDEKGFYVYYAEMRHGIMYNAALLREEEAPRSYTELTDPKWKNRVTLVDPATGGMAVYLARFIVQHPALGFDWLKKMGGNGVLLSYQVPQLGETVASGRRVVGLGRDLETVTEQRRGANVKFLLPKEGFPVQHYPVGINRKAPHPYAARLFVDWLLSEEGRVVHEELGYAVPKGTFEEIQKQGAWILDIEKYRGEDTKEFKTQASELLIGR